MLDALERGAQNEHGDHERREGCRDSARDVHELERSGNPGELRGCRPDVRGQQRECRGEPDPEPVPVADQTGEPLAGHDTHACPELVEEHQRDRCEREHPQEAVAVLCTEDRIGCDTRGVVVGEPGEEAGSDDRGESEQAASASHVAERDGMESEAGAECSFAAAARRGSTARSTSSA